MAIHHRINGERAANTAYDAIMSGGGLTDLQPYGNFNDPQNLIFLDSAYIYR